jgi:hypothetical protein
VRFIRAKVVTETPFNTKRSSGDKERGIHVSIDSLRGWSGDRPRTLPKCRVFALRLLGERNALKRCPRLPIPAIGTSNTDSSTLELDYTYGLLVGGTLDVTKNNGNLQSQTIKAQELQP